MLAAMVFASVAVALGLAPRGTVTQPMTAPRCGVVRTGVGPSARRRGVVRPGVATDYCVQTLGCTLEDAVRAEAKMLPQVANSVRRDKAEVVCAELRAKLGLSDNEMRKLVLRVPTVLTLNMDKNVNPKLDWLQERLDLSRDELKKICLTLPATLAYSVDKNLEPKLSYFEHELGMSPQEIRSKIISMPAPVWKSTSVSGAPDNSSLSHFSMMTRPCWPRRAMKNRHRHAIEQAAGRWSGGRRDDSAVKF